ncbi:Beta-glucanase 1 [Colletotrichum chlorophyti]|uniref:Beta-glucanase 1 n=1 Tax=Colletotrichum chlorophyti TaxID=708187 RepID=A0A1Q8S4B6_9PEZI|nr:Beta-glucanase 1 [Colletotrichum chlorophyti]
MRLAGVAASLLLALPAAQAQIPKINNFNLIWGDDFLGRQNTLPDSKIWTIDVGTSYPGGPPNWGTWEVQTYTNSPNNVRLSGTGSLQITAIKNATSGKWTSARIESKRADFMAQPKGILRIQASLKIPNLGKGGAGYWPAFWTLGAAYRGNYWNWPAVGEIDIMENVNNADRVWAVLHCGTQPGGVCNEPSGLGNNRNCPNSACVGNFHTYTVEVDRSKSPEAIRWYVDNVQFHQILETQLPKETWKQTVQKPHFVLLNMAVGGAFPDAVAGQKTPLSTTLSGGILEVQYVAVYHTR